MKHYMAKYTIIFMGLWGWVIANNIL